MSLKSSTNCGCGHLMMQFVGIAECNSSYIYIAMWGVDDSNANL